MPSRSEVYEKMGLGAEERALAEREPAFQRGLAGTFAYQTAELRIAAKRLGASRALEALDNLERRVARARNEGLRRFFAS